MKVTAPCFSAGSSRPTIEQVSVAVPLPPMQEFVPAHMKATPWASSFLDLTGKVEAIEFMDKRLEEFRTPTGINVPFSSYLATSNI